jgi:hypothetical protein
MGGQLKNIYIQKRMAGFIPFVVDKNKYLVY